jgi:hypothetical protein
MEPISFTQIGFIILVLIVAIMIYTGRRKQPLTPPSSSNLNKRSPFSNSQTNNIYEKNREQQMQIMNVLYENIADDILDYNNKPTGLFVIP